MSELWVDKEFKVEQSKKGKIMITVSILINGNPLMARSAVNKGDVDNMGRARYACDDGTHIRHNPGDGAVALAKKMLDTIVEDN